MNFLSLIAIVSTVVSITVCINEQDLSHFKGDEKNVATKLGNANTCVERLVLPLTQLFLPSNDTFTKLCGVTYFDGCRDAFRAKCNQSPNCSRTVDSNYMAWIDAYSKNGRQFTCQTGLKAIVDTLKNGGYNCFATLGGNIMIRVTELGEYIWSAPEITCTQMAKRIYGVTYPISECKDQKLRNLVGSYFETVIGASPCAKSIEMNAGIHTRSSDLTLLLMAALSVLAFLLNQY